MQGEGLAQQGAPISNRVGGCVNVRAYAIDPPSQKRR